MSVPVRCPRCKNVMGSRLNSTADEYMTVLGRLWWRFARKQWRQSWTKRTPCIDGGFHVHGRLRIMGPGFAVDRHFHDGRAGSSYPVLLNRKDARLARWFCARVALDWERGGGIVDIEDVG